MNEESLAREIDFDTRLGTKRESQEGAKSKDSSYLCSKERSFFCLTTRFIQAKWKMDLHYCSEYDKKKDGTGLFLLHIPLCIIDLVLSFIFLTKCLLARSSLDYK